VSPAIELPGLRADSPAGALVLYGLASLLPRSARVRWKTSSSLSWHAEVSDEGLHDLGQLVGLVVEAIKADSLTGLPSVAPDLNKLTPEGWVAASVRPDAVGRVIAGLSAQAPLRPQGQVPFTPLCVISFRGKGSFFGPAVKQDTTIKVPELSELLAGPWRYRKACNTLGLDPDARRQDGAVIGPDPSADGVRGVPGLVPLALRGLAAVAPMPGETRLRGGAFAGTSQGTEFRWPVVVEPVPVDALPLVAARDWESSSDAQRAAASVEAVFASRILRGERRLSAGRRVA